MTNLPVYPDLIEGLENVLKNEYPKVKCHFYGSRMTGVAYNRSPLDIYIDLCKLIMKLFIFYFDFDVGHWNGSEPEKTSKNFQNLRKNRFLEFEKLEGKSPKRARNFSSQSITSF